MSWIREIFTAFVPVRIGEIGGDMVYYRKRLLHSGYQLLVRRCEDGITEMEKDMDTFYQDVCWLELYKNYKTKQEMFNEVIAK